MIDIPILFDDDNLTVIGKPSGVVVNRAESVTTETIQDWFLGRNPEISQFARASEFVEKGGVVHRIDKDTSGILVLAKTEESYEFLKKQFLERTTTKEYVTLVHGKLKNTEGVISLPIERHSKNKHKFAVGTDPSRMAITEYTVKQTYSKHGETYSFVQLGLHTGRTHQIRVHMKHLGHPLVSDPIYGGKTYKKDVTWCPRLFLHAQKLGIIHPKTLLQMEFSLVLPVDLQAVLDSLDTEN